jgi:hypothetical protein
MAMEREPRDWSGRGSRRDTRLTAAVFWPDGSSAAVQVSNLSYEGCELCSTRGFRKGETVRIAVPGRGKIAAQIRWVKDNRVGAVFLTGDSATNERRARLGV